MSISKKTKLAAALGAAFLATSVAPLASADTNPFAANQLSSGYDLANFGAHAEKADKEGKCGEGKCGEGKKAEKEGSCGEGKAAKEGSCGEGKAEKAGKEGKCGEGKCGG
ncbi:MAG: putative low-complexity protein [Oceanicoccus sp.]|jgi:uncharacterized low-complexity protein